MSQERTLPGVAPAAAPDPLAGLIQAVAGPGGVVICTHRNPDPDAISSAEDTMTRGDMFVNPVREDWMTDELIAGIKGVARDGKITCAAAQQFARDNGIVMNKMKAFVDVVGLKVQSCQLGCF